MVKITRLTVLILAFGLAAIALAGDQVKVEKQAAWFDMKNCAFCQHLAENDQLLDNMTWEYHDISNGLVAITTVQPDYRKAYKKAQDHMMKLGQELETGQRKMSDLNMCGHCLHYGKLTEAGVKFDYVQADAADIVLITTADSTSLAMIRDFGERNRDELAKWKAARSPK